MIVYVLLFAATIFAYGQSGSGKTYTMRGIMEKAVDDIYNHMTNVSSEKPFVDSSLLYFFVYWFMPWVNVLVWSAPIIAVSAVVSAVCFTKLVLLLFVFRLQRESLQ